MPSREATGCSFVTHHSNCATPDSGSAAAMLASMVEVASCESWWKNSPRPAPANRISGGVASTRAQSESAGSEVRPASLVAHTVKQKICPCRDS